MISLAHPVRVFLHSPATDLRAGFDALSGLGSGSPRSCLEPQARGVAAEGAASWPASCGAKAPVDVRPGELSRFEARPHEPGTRGRSPPRSLQNSGTYPRGEVALMLGPEGRGARARPPHGNFGCLRKSRNILRVPGNRLRGWLFP
jgi:hypothetical protein